MFSVYETRIPLIPGFIGVAYFKRKADGSPVRLTSVGNPNAVTLNGEVQTAPFAWGAVAGEPSPFWILQIT